MPGRLDLIWKPTRPLERPPNGQAPAIYRGDDYSLLLKFWTDETKTIPLPLTGTFAAQLRTARMGDISPVPAVLAAFSILSPAAGQLELVIPAATTLALNTVPTRRLHWDLQNTNGAAVITLLDGDAIVEDDVTRT